LTAFLLVVAVAVDAPRHQTTALVVWLELVEHGRELFVLQQNSLVLKQ
jgi:hypothetical protein